MPCVFSSHQYNSMPVFHSYPPVSSNLLNVQLCCYCDAEEETESFYSRRRRRRKLKVHLFLSFLVFIQLCSFQVSFHSTGRPWPCSLVILERKVTLLICSLCQWHLSWIWRELGEKGQGNSTDTNLKGKKWRSSRVSLKIVSNWCKYCQRWWRSRHLLPCMSVMTATQGRNPISLHASQGNLATLAVLMAEESCQLCSFLQHLCRKASLAPSLWRHNGEKVERKCKMWTCNGLQLSQNEGKKTSNL